MSSEPVLLHPPPRKRGSACTRCRLQKVRCGGQHPSCSNCLKAGVVCLKPPAENESTKEYVSQLEKRTRWLEDTLRRVSPEALLRANVHFIDGDRLVKSSEEQELEARLTGSQAAAANTFTASSGTPTQPQETRNHAPSSDAEAATVNPSSQQKRDSGLGHPLANDVGLISLANSAEPKYLGHSSGITFARLIFAAAPQSQGLSTSIHSAPMIQMNPQKPSKKADDLAQLPPEDEVRYFVDAYFEVWHPLYPFLHEELFQNLILRVQSRGPQSNFSNPQTASQSMDLAQFFLVVALGAKILESRLSTNFSADAYHSTAMFHIGNVPLHERIRGVQVLLLLVLSSLSFVDGLNAWFLNHTILASCLDLGLQRKYTIGRPRNTQSLTPEESEATQRTKEVRSGIFWSAYSLDRTLCVILGRPLTLRDEAIDIEFPGQWDGNEDFNATEYRTTVRGEPPRKKPRGSHARYSAAIYSFRFDRIIGEIKLMLYRLAQSFNRFPWPTDIITWQGQTAQACKDLLEDARQDIKYNGLPGGRAALQDRTMRFVELKYHQCMMLLNRPSPAVPQPSSAALMACYESAVATIRIQSDLARFGNMLDSWLTTHAVFVSGITMLYCLWTSPEVRTNTDIKILLQQADSCSKLLLTLSKTWTVAQNAQTKFEQLVQLTKDSWEKSRVDSNSASPEQCRIVQNDLSANGEMATSMDTYSAIDNLPPGFWDDININYEVPPNMLMDELGDVSNWFDLDWLGDANLSTEPYYY